MGIVVGGDADLVRKVEDFADLSTLVAQCTTTATTSTTTSTYTRSSSTATTTTSTTTTTNFKAPLPYRLMALCATALGLICTCMCMVISCSQHIAQRNKAYDAESQMQMLQGFKAPCATSGGHRHLCCRWAGRLIFMTSPLFPGNAVWKH